MATPGLTSEVIYHDALVNYLVSMARAAETAVNRAIEALLGERGERTSAIASQIFLLEPRINEMEIVIDEHALRLLRKGNLPEHEIRLVVATLKITNDLERMGDLAVNIGERVISLAQMPPVAPPQELGPMAEAVRAMVEKTLGALIFRNISLAKQVLESDDFVDQSRDRLFQHLLASMAEQPEQVAPSFQFALAIRYLERIADHATNIAEDTIFWLRGLDVRHGRARVMDPDADVNENS